MPPTPSHPTPPPTPRFTRTCPVRCTAIAVSDADALKPETPAPRGLLDMPPSAANLTARLPLHAAASLEDDLLEEHADAGLDHGVRLGDGGGGGEAAVEGRIRTEIRSGARLGLDGVTLATPTGERVGRSVRMMVVVAVGYAIRFFVLVFACFVVFCFFFSCVQFVINPTNPSANESHIRP